MVLEAAVVVSLITVEVAVERGSPKIAPHHCPNVKILAPVTETRAGLTQGRMMDSKPP